MCSAAESCSVPQVDLHVSTSENIYNRDMCSMCLNWLNTEHVLRGDSNSQIRMTGQVKSSQSARRGELRGEPTQGNRRCV